jgi:hypothetical protein
VRFVSAEDGSVALANECILGNLTFDSVDPGVCRVALPLEIGEGLVEASNLSVETSKDGYSHATIRLYSSSCPVTSAALLWS